MDARINSFLTFDRWVAAGRDVVGFITYCVQRFFHDRCLRTASALAYTSLLALVPLLTLSFAIFAAFPAFDNAQAAVRQIIFQNLVPEASGSIAGFLEGFIDHGGSLTTFGVIGLAVTSVMLLANIESAVNNIWRTARARPVATRLLAFWAILTLLPLTVGVSITVSGMISNIGVALGIVDVSQSFVDVRWVVPMLVSWAVFTALFLVLPARPVRFSDAAVGAGVAAFTMEVLKTFFAMFLANSEIYTTLYGALAVLPIFLVWIYMVWSVVLIGAVVAAALPEWRAGKLADGGIEGLLPSQKLATALAILEQLALASLNGRSVPRNTLLRRVRVGAVILDDMLHRLEDDRWIVRTDGLRYVASRDLDQATLYDLMEDLTPGVAGRVAPLDVIGRSWQPMVINLLERADGTVKDMLRVSIAALIGRPEDRAAILPLPAVEEEAPGRRAAGSREAEND